MHRHLRSIPITRLAALAIATLPLLAVLHAAPASAKRAPVRDEKSAALTARKASMREAEALEPMKVEGAIQRRFGAESGLLRRYWRHSAPVAQARNIAPQLAAREFLLANAGSIGFTPDQIERDLVLAYEKGSPSGTHLRWNQTFNGVPVYRSEIVVKVAPSGEISSVHNNLVMGLDLATKPTLGKAEALARAIDAVQPTGKPLGEFQAELAIVNFASRPRLVYRVSVPVEAPMGDWVVSVDAQSGSIVGVEDQMVYATGTGQVFDPDPETKLNNPSLPDNADADTGIPFPGAYDIRTLLDITNTAGTYSLSGPFARIIEFESPVVTPYTATHPDSFRFQRSAQAFEDVMDYYQLDNYQRYIQSLGFTNINNRVQEMDTHGLSGADNSHYIPSNKRIAFGEGGVDDAEDTDIVVHEYGHSIQDNIVPGWGGGQEGAMGEGFGDYIAGSYSRDLFPLYQPNFVFNWDGHNEFWDGRLLIDPTLHYPENCCGEVHDSGTLWCSGLTDAWQILGRTVMDRVVFDHHFALGTSATMADAAQQIIQSDFDLYGGTHVGTLVTVFDTWGFVNAEDFIPTITHTPLTDTENTAGPYTITATITSAQPLDVSSLKVHYGTTGSFTDSLLMTATANPNEYSAAIPGPLSNVNVRYYIIARDNSNGTATHPTGAPASFHQFHVGADVTPPVIVHTPRATFPRIQWPASIQAGVTDNLGVNHDSVRVDWSINAAPKAPFYMPRIGLTTNYAGTFPSDTTQVIVGDVIAYRITARDVATVPNLATSPPSGDHSFTIIASRGTVLVLDNDEVAAHASSKLRSPEDTPKGENSLVEAKSTPAGQITSAVNLAAALNTLGFTATLESAFTSNSATWSSYGLVISSSGSNLDPVANAPYRAALEAYVAGGGKLLVEGGEVEYDGASTPGYPTFAANVLHTIDWDADNAGSLQKLAGQAGHPIANIPNVLPTTLPIAYVGFASEDSYKPAAPAYIVYGVTAQPGNGGILVYDNTPSPQSAQIVLFGFDWKLVSDLATRTNLLENTVQYLLAPEAPPTSGVSGRVYIAAQSNYSGVTVTLSPGGASMVTDSTGNYAFSGQYAGTYTVSASKTGYRTANQTGVTLAQNSTVSHVNLVLYPEPIFQACLTPGTAIPDNNAVGVTSDMIVAPAFTVASVELSVNIPHTFIGDLIVELRHGATTVRVHNRTGGSLANLVRNYPSVNTPDGPGTLANFAGSPSNGTWTLFVSDNAGQDLGNIAQWCLTLHGVPDTTLAVAVTNPTAPSVAWLAPAQPNPVRASGTEIRFALPTSTHAALEIFDVSGRRVRTLVDGMLQAGTHSERWNGRDAAGRPVASGVYLYRLRAGSFTGTRRVVVVSQ
ncbi:MAG: T9SS type A sorting domain-containing protein [Candidatus Eisenbacteria bacterium]|uniref:T9SS type A sorting domain-containing protein n=1 Tax=Eiseniibacteriota bacterium TaxID=2212470 RepID=A0A849SIJ3_UNCEI|nr:T9SS type A sorting domain-containing protein [Candidatus Eisenbacteria bacterium]